MLVTNVTTTPDATLPLYLPDLPSTVTHRWVADSRLTDGPALTLAPVVGSTYLTDATGGATTSPTAGTVDGLRGITFDGTDDAAFALNVNPGPGGSVTGYAVVKILADPAANRSVIHWSTGAMGVNPSRKFYVNAAVLATALTLGAWYAVGWSIKRNTGSGDSEMRVAASTGETATALSQSIGALTTYAAFGVGAASVKTNMVARDLALNIGTAHSTAQLQANVAALAAEYGIA